MQVYTVDSHLFRPWYITTGEVWSALRYKAPSDTLSFPMEVNEAPREYRLVHMLYLDVVHFPVPLAPCALLPRTNRKKANLALVLRYAVPTHISDAVYFSQERRLVSHLTG